MKFEEFKVKVPNAKKVMEKVNKFQEDFKNAKDAKEAKRIIQKQLLQSLFYIHLHPHLQVNTLHIFLFLSPAHAAFDNRSHHQLPYHLIFDN